MSTTTSVLSTERYMDSICKILSLVHPPIGFGFVQSRLRDVDISDILRMYGPRFTTQNIQIRMIIRIGISPSSSVVLLLLVLGKCETIDIRFVCPLLSSDAIEQV
jgi:hypothetical protein